VSLQKLISVACFAATMAGTAAPAAAQDVAKGEKDFVVCRACHQIGPNAKNAVGPVLNGVVGRKAGTYPGFKYSEANRDSGIVWSPEELQQYLTDPQKVVPKTLMIFPGLKDQQKRTDVIAFLQQFGPDGAKTQ
jgi:cytochrome c